MQKSWLKILKAKKIAIDTETTGLNAWKGDMPFGISFCTEDGDKLYFEWPVDPFTRKVKPNKKELAFCKKVLENPNTTKVFFHAKFDIRMMEVAYGIKTVWPISEVMFMAFVCNTLEPSFKLKKLAEKYLDYGTEDLDLLKKQVMSCRRKAKKLGWNIAEKVEGDYWLPKAFNSKNKTCEKYCVNDAERTMLLENFFQHGMDELEVRHSYEKEMKLWPVIYDMETRGISVDPKVIEKEISYHKEKAKYWKQELQKYAWDEFNPNSPVQLVKLFYEKMKLPVLFYTDKGNPQVNDIALKPYIQYPAVKAIFKYRASSKANNAFFERYKRLMIPDTVCEGFALHPNFQQARAATARLACKMPNFQNVPNYSVTRSIEPVEARRPFGPRKGYVWYHYDYAQMEARIFAHDSNDRLMLKAFKEGRDIFNEMTNQFYGGETDIAIKAGMHLLELDGTGREDFPAVQILWKKYGIKKLSKLSIKNKEHIAKQWLSNFNWKIAEAEKSLGKKILRSDIKAIFYLKIYGGGVQPIMSLLECDRESAQEILNGYDKAFPNIKRYQRKTMYQAGKDGYIINSYGRRLSLDSNRTYCAMNYMVQGDAADLLKEVMILCSKYLKNIGLDIHLILTIHDELIFEFYKKHVFKSVLLELKRLMEDPNHVFSIPMPTDVERCVKSWNDKEAIEL